MPNEIDKRDLKLHARLAAIECMIGHLSKIIFKLTDATPAMIEESHRKLREYLRTESFEGVDAVKSDLLVAELEDAFDHLLKVIAEMAGVEKNPK